MTRIEACMKAIAQDIVDAPALPSFHVGATLQASAKSAAQLYLDNLSDGLHEPDELIDVLADIEQQENEQAAEFIADRRAGYSDWDWRPAESYVPAGDVA